MNKLLWIAQVILGLAFLAHGLMLLFPPASIVEQMNSSMSREFQVFLGVAEVLAAVGLTDRADHYPRQLSGGQEQRVGIARAIVAHPTVVVADEPTGSLDSETSQQIQVLLKRLNKELNITMLMVTHDRDVAGIASRQLLLDHGQILERTPANGAPHHHPVTTEAR